MALLVVSDNTRFLFMIVDVLLKNPQVVLGDPFTNNAFQERFLAIVGMPMSCPYPPIVKECCSGIQVRTSFEYFDWIL